MDVSLHASRHHFGWDRALEPIATVPSGSTVTFEVADASGGQLSPGSDAGEVLHWDSSRVNPVTGPVHIEDAQPGDALRIHIAEVIPTSDWGWTALIPGFGLLADEFGDPALHHWEYDATGPAAFAGVAQVPVRPFVGTIGLAPAEAGPHSIIPPRRVGGNLDTRDLCAGTTLWLPVEAPGALLSVGDTHAAQGDGEVCGTAIESPMTVVVTVDVEPGAAPAFPVYETTQHSRDTESRDGVLATTGVGPDLMDCARDAVRAMIDLLGVRVGLEPAMAYMLCSVAADLRISEIVDAPNWVVSCALPKAVLSG